MITVLREVKIIVIKIQAYVEKIVSMTKPKKILICMIYHPDENQVIFNCALHVYMYANAYVYMHIYVYKNSYI
jgi:hypothetical protein